MTTYTKKAVRGAGIMLVMSIFANFVAYLTRLYLARSLAPAGYGLFYSVFTFVIFFLFFRDLGLGQALVKYISEFRAKRMYNFVKTAFVSVVAFQFISSIIFGAVFFLLSEFLSEHYFKNPMSLVMLKILVVYVMLSVFYGNLKDLLQGFQKFRIISMVDFLKNSIVLLLIALFFGLGIKNAFAPVFAYVLACPILFFILLPFALKTFPFFKYKVENFKQITKKIFIFGIPVLVTSVGGKVIGYIDTLILTNFRSLEEVGIYNVMLPSAMLFLYFGISVSSVAFPIVSELWAKKDKIRISEGIRLLHKYAFMLVIPMVFTVLAFSRLFINLLFGKEYLAGATALEILLIGVLFYIVAGINDNIIAGLGKPKTVTKIILFCALINFVMNILVIPKYGMEGAAVATSLSYFVALILSTYQVTKLIEIEFPKLIWLKLAAAGVLFVSVISVVKGILVLNPWIELIVSALAAGIAYLAAIYFLKIIDIAEIKKYMKLVR